MALNEGQYYPAREHLEVCRGVFDCYTVLGVVGGVLS